MPKAVLEAYKTLTIEAQQEVERLIYFLASQQEKNKVSDDDPLTSISKFVGKCNSWKDGDALAYQDDLRKERV